MAKEEQIKYIDNRDFTDALNTIDNPLAIPPSASPYMVNMDIARNGSAVTRFGYEKVATIGGASGPMRGLLPYYNTYGTYKNDYLLLFHNNGNVYVIKNSDLIDGQVVDIASKSVGAYGLDNGTVYGIVFDNIAIFGNGLAANVVKKYDGNTLGTLGGSPPDGNIFGTFGQRAFIAGDATAMSKVYYSDVDDPEKWTVGTDWININVGDGQVVTSLINNNDFLQVYKDDSVYGLEFQYDATYNLSIPIQKQIVTSQGGAISHGSVQAVYGYTFYLSNKGFETYGPNPQRIVADMPIPLSFKINPTINGINFAQKSQITSALYDQKYYCAAPYRGALVNNFVFIYDENIKRRFNKDNWAVYQGLPIQMLAKFRDAENRDQLYFTSNIDSGLYKFNKTFSDDGIGYLRLWRSKSFSFGDRTYWRYIDLEGSKTLGSTIYVDIDVDQQNAFSIEVTDENLLPNNSGGYIGDNYTGDTYMGGSESPGKTTPMFRYKKRIRFPDNVNMGYQMYFQLRNINEGEGWSLNRYVVCYTPDPNDPTYSYTD